MANFTDQPIQFTPYVETTPVQAMVAVGMQKEQDFKQGIAKVQAYVDTIAGLDIAKEEDKQYVSSKLNEVKEGIAKNLSGDFSDSRITNQIGGAAVHIYKDPIVQNAVISTTNYRKGIADMELARKEGKSSIANEWDFQNNANKWLTDKTQGTLFNGKYSPFTNYRKNALDVIKSLTKDETITDSAFTTDSKGNLVITDAIVRKKLAGISPEKIQQALMAGLNPNDFQQMEIDGRYHYSNVPNSDFAQNTLNSYKEKIKFFDDQKQVLTNALSSTSSSVEKQTLQSQIQSLDKTMGNIKNEYESVSNEMRNGNIDGAKARLHTLNFINGFSKAFSFTETSNQYESSPFVQAAQFRETKAQDWKKFMLEYNQKESHFQTNTNLKLTELQLKEKENELKKKELEGYGGLPSPIDQSQLPTYTLSRVVDEVVAGQKEIEAENNTFIKNQGKDQKWLDQQRVAWEKNPNGVDPLVAEHFNDIAGRERTILSKQTMITDIEADAKKRVGDINQFIPKDAPSIVFTTPSGQTTITAKNLVDFNEKFREYATISAPTSGGTGGASVPSITYNDEKAKRDLSPKEFLLYNIFKKHDKGQKLNDAEKTIVDHAHNYFTTVNVPNRKLIQDVNTYTAQEVTRRITNMQGVSYAIPTATTAQKTSIGTMLSQFADLADKQTGGIANSPNFNSKIARQLATDDNAKYSIQVVEGTSSQAPMYEVSVTGQKGSTSFVITPEQKASVFGNAYEPSPEVQAFRPYQEQIRMMGGYTTNLNKNSDLNSSYLNKADFPSIKNYGIKGDIVTSKGKYSLRLSIYDPITQEWKQDIPFPRKQLTSESGIMQAMLNLTDVAVYELINEKLPTAVDLKNLETASKKPL